MNKEENKSKETIFMVIDRHKILISVGLIILAVIWINFFQYLLHDFGLVQQGVLLDLKEFLLIVIMDILNRVFMNYVMLVAIMYIFLPWIVNEVDSVNLKIAEIIDSMYIKLVIDNFKEKHKIISQVLFNLIIFMLIVFLISLLIYYMYNMILLLTIILLILDRYKNHYKNIIELIYTNILVYISLVFLVFTLLIPIRYSMSPITIFKKNLGKNYNDMTAYFDMYKSQTGFPKLMKNKKTNEMYYFVGYTGNNYYFYDVKKAQEVRKDIKENNTTLDVNKEYKRYIIENEYLKAQNSQIYIKNKKDNLFKYEEIDLKYIWDINCTYTNKEKEK